MSNSNMMPKSRQVTVDRLREVFISNPESGKLTWRISTSIRTFAGDPAGRVCRYGYRRIDLDGTTLFAHRIAWAMFHGSWPAGPLDHINRLKDDNRISNLRECTQSQNAQNRKAAINNRHGTKGITPLRNGKWQAQIRVNGKNMFLGSFVDKHDASNAYNTAAKLAFGDFVCSSVVAP